MKFIRYSKFNGFDVFGIDLGDLMDSLSNQMLDSGYNEDYWWTRQRNDPDDSLDALRQAILKALLEQEILNEQDVEQMLADNDGKFRGSLLEELINQADRAACRRRLSQSEGSAAGAATRSRDGQWARAKSASRCRGISNSR